MMRAHLTLSLRLVACLAVVATGCGGHPAASDGFDAGQSEAAGETSAEVPTGLDAVDARPGVVPKGTRLFGIDTNEAAEGDKSYDTALAVARGAGVDFVSLTVLWEQMETAPGVFEPLFNTFAIAEIYYPAKGMAVALSIASPLDTNGRHMPPDLAAKRFDDPAVIARFKTFLDWAFAQIPTLELVYVSLGNEIDGPLGTGKDAWDQYQAFFEAVAPHVRAKRPGVPVGVKTQYGGLVGPAAAHLFRLNGATDAVFANHYPLEGDFAVRPPGVIRGDLDALVGRYPGRRIFMTEVGYPSSPACKSTEEMQRDFFVELFRAWDAHAGVLGLVNIVWLHDVPAAQVDEFARYYGLATPGFKGYLGSIGIRTPKGTDKKAFPAVVAEAGARGW